ncbi:MAG: hypothetical protein ACLVC2_03150 [Emergencia timonensis]
MKWAPRSSFRAFRGLQVAGYILSNGLIDGMAIAFLLEHVILKKRAL